MRLMGTAAVAPMIFFEAFLPSARRFFHHPMRFPIADAHYAMGFAFLYQATGDFSQLENAIHFLTELEKSRCHQFKEYCWGYPFDWVTRNGISKNRRRSSPPPLMPTRLSFRSRNPPSEDRGQRTEDRGQDLLDEYKQSSNRLRDTPRSISRISGRRKTPAVVPILLSIRAESSTRRLIALSC